MLLNYPKQTKNYGNEFIFLKQFKQQFEVKVRVFVMKYFIEMHYHHDQEEVDICALQQELAQKNMQIEQLQQQISNLDVIMHFLQIDELV